jgi:hypothetical protein
MTTLSAALNNMSFAVTGASGLSGASGGTIKINVASGPSGPVVTFDASALTQTIQQLQVSQNYDPASGEMKTGGTYNGKPVYRRAWSFTVTTNAKSPDNAPLIATSGYVQDIINSGGNFATGDTSNGVANNVERYNVPATLINWTGSTVQDQVHGFPLVTTDNQLRFASLSTKNRTNAPTYVWVEYTKVNESMV